MKAFRAPKTALGNLDAEAVAMLIACAADIVVILDEAGVIQDVAITAPDLPDDLAGHAGWHGKRWADTVSSDSVQKVEQLIADASSRNPPQWRHLNYPAAHRSPDVPILYAAVQAGVPGRLVAFGRDMRRVSWLQRRLVDAQQSMERDYARTRQIETRYRLLFQMAPDAVLVVDGGNRRILESNPAANRLLDVPSGSPVGQRISGMFSDATAGSVEHLLAGVLASGRADDVHARLARDETEVVVSASPFRDAGGRACLVHIAVPRTQPSGVPLPKLKAKLLKLMEGAPDAFVVTGDDGRVMTVNASFLELAQLPNEERALGMSLDRWVGHAGADVDILMTNLRHHGTVRLFATTLQGELGEQSEVEVSAVTVMNGGQPCFGYAIRDVGRRLASETGRERTLPRSFDNLTELIGRVALKDLVREVTDVIERLCIEAALELSSDNRASAAEMLGLSRQSLYVKLRRYGLGDPAAEGAN